MTTPLSKLQLNAVLSALDGQPRNPNSREAALKRIGRHAETLGLDLDALLTTAQGLLDGRMDSAAFVAALRAPGGGREEPQHHDEPPAADPAELSNPSSDASAPAAVPPLCPTCGRRMRRGRVRGSADYRPGTHRDGSKEARVIAMLRRPEGATIAQIMSATGWQSHTVRGLFSGALKKRHGLTITSDKPQGGERTYRIDSQ